MLGSPTYETYDPRSSPGEHLEGHEARNKRTAHTFIPNRYQPVDIIPPRLLKITYPLSRIAEFCGMMRKQLA